MALRIRAVDGGAPKIRALLRYLQLETLPGDIPVDTRRDDWWIAYDGSLAVGFAGMREAYSMPEVGYLERCGVMRSYRGRGLQQRFIRIRIRRARSYG